MGPRNNHAYCHNGNLYTFGCHYNNSKNIYTRRWSAAVSLLTATLEGSTYMVPIATVKNMWIMRYSGRCLIIDCPVYIYANNLWPRHSAMPMSEPLVCVCGSLRVQWQYLVTQFLLDSTFNIVLQDSKRQTWAHVIVCLCQFPIILVIGVHCSKFSDQCMAILNR